MNTLPVASRLDSRGALQPPKNGESPEDSHYALSSLSHHPDHEYPSPQTLITSLDDVHKSSQDPQTSSSPLICPTHESPHLLQTSPSLPFPLHETLPLPPNSAPMSLSETASVDETHTALEDQTGTIKQISSPVRPKYDPKQLLNPKSFDAVNRQKQEGPDSATIPREARNPIGPSGFNSPEFVFDSPDRDSGKRFHAGDENPGMGGLIERFHNVAAREERPIKKLKTQHLDGDEITGPKAAFGGGGKGGEIGEYMRMKRKEGQAEAVQAFSVVDLTTGESFMDDALSYVDSPIPDDEDVTVVENANDREVCYGRIDNAKVQAHLVPTPNPKATYLSKTDWPSIKLHLHRYPGKNMIIRVIDPAGKDFGNIDVRTSLGLSPVMDSKFSNIRIQARLDPRKKKPNEFPGQFCSEYYNATINLYGPRSSAAGIGKFLSQKQVFLRLPFGVDKGIEVFNPHLIKNPVIQRTTLNGSAGGATSAGYVTRTVEEIRNDVVGMFDSLEKSENLPEMEPDGRITTPLLSHQKQGLHFMTSKEQARVFADRDEDNNSLWRLQRRANGQPIYFNVITGREERSRPPEVLGGILADMMGLGKTLSILSLIVGTLDAASEWAAQPPPSTASEGGILLKRNSKTTLLVAPLSVVANWEEQIIAHIQPGTLSCYIYHGNSRCQDIDELASYDVVITTYSIISSEYNGRSKKRDGSPILQTNFFRVVLDEAHMIREQSTRQFQAICTLAAQRRWAVTGTPVQNRLDDLGALIKFLRFKPFDERGGFTQFILAPFKNADPEILPKLRLLVDSITLRRLKDRIDLPPRHDNVVRLQFSKDERELYEWFAKDSDNRMKIIAGQKKGLGGKTYVHVLQAILRLRLICAHGKELLSEDDLKLTEGFSSTNAIDLDDDDDGKPLINKRQAYEMLMLFKETDSDTCSQCLRRIGSRDPNLDDAKDEVIGCMLPCFQIVCNDCVGEVKKSINEKATDNHFTCPFCEQYLRLSFFDLTQGGIEDAEEAKIVARENPRQAKIMGRYGGPHTKTTALMEGLLDSKIESLENPNDPPIKSVVFSGWTAHLDLIQIALEDNGIQYVRLDGKMSRIQRSTSLEVFHTDPEIAVILVSISAGGLGLNLTTASKVYVMEPQFNPAAEAQAIDRVHRLGQKREVTTTRFIMHDSFEEKMLLLQQKKNNLATMSMNRGKLDKAEIAKQKLEELRSLFK
ncbi:hypothetical protein MMC15_002116 [Xylographa vitiligo]|nr:hypothetical protein [Xylographa vitiligo]